MGARGSSPVQRIRESGLRPERMRCWSTSSVRAASR
jgi:hypothetical protein